MLLFFTCLLFQAPQPNQALFVENLCDVFSSYFPDFWHLGQDYFGGKLAIKPDLRKQADMKV